MAKEREIFIDVARAIGIFLVVCGHYVYFMHIPYEDSGNLMWSIARCVTLFHMPLFFVISGYLYKPIDSIKILLLNVGKRLIIPYLLICLVALAVGVVLKILQSEWTISIAFHEIFHNLFGILTGDDFQHSRMLFCDSMWYVYSLVIVRMLYGAIDSLCSPPLVVKIIMAVLTLGGLYVGNNIPLRIDCSIVGLLFFTIGDISKPIVSKISAMKYDYKILLIILQVVSLTLCGYFNIYLYGETGLSINRMNYGHYPMLFLLSGLSGSLLVLLISSFIKDNTIVTTMSKNSIIILGFHQILMMIIGYNNNIRNLWWIALGICVAVCILCCLLGNILRKFVPAFVGYR